MRTKDSRQFGSVWLGLELLKRLGLLEFFREKLPREKEEISWAERATILLLARLVHPNSELSAVEQLYARTTLPEPLGIPAVKASDDRLCRALDTQIHTD